MPFKRLIQCSLLGLSSCIVIGVLAITAYGLNDQVSQAELVIVPGNTVNPNGTPSPRLAARLNAALQLYQSGHCQTVLVSGGIGKEGFDEAEVMKLYLVSQGIPASAIVTDNQGNNTLATAKFAASFMRSKGLHSAIIVSQYFHLARFNLAMNQHEIQPTGHVHAPYFEVRDLYSLIREVFGFVSYSLKASSLDAAQAESRVTAFK